MTELDYYVPDFGQFSTLTGLSKDALSGETVTIPARLLKLLLSAVVAGVRFDEAAYRAKYADVAEAERNGGIQSLHEHFIGTGWFEGRAPGEHHVDEDWYLSTYRDLAIALRRGLIDNPTKHFNEVGRAEGRVGSSEQAKWKQRWEEALGVNQSLPAS